MTREGLERRLFPELRPRERGRFLFFAALSALLTGAQTVGLAGTDALFLAELGPSWLPLSFIMASAVAVTGVPGCGQAPDPCSVAQD